MSIAFEAVHQVKIERISIHNFVWKNYASFLDSTRFISQINNIHFPLLMLCPSSTHSSISLIFPSTVDISSVCSLIDRTEIKINICTIPTLHPLVSIRSSLLCSALTIPHTPSHHPPWNKSVQDNWAALSLWNEGWDMERERLQLWAAHWWYLSLHSFVFSLSLFYVGLTGNCAAVIQDQGEREREGEREGKVLNCCNKLQISHRLSINVIKTQSTNTTHCEGQNTLVPFYIPKMTSV